MTQQESAWWREHDSITMSCQHIFLSWWRNQLINHTTFTVWLIYITSAVRKSIRSKSKRLTFPWLGFGLLSQSLNNHSMSTWISVFISAWCNQVNNHMSACVSKFFWLRSQSNDSTAWLYQHDVITSAAGRIYYVKVKEVNVFRATTVGESHEIYNGRRAKFIAWVVRKLVTVNNIKEFVRKLSKL